MALQITPFTEDIGIFFWFQDIKAISDPQSSDPDGNSPCMLYAPRKTAHHRGTTASGIPSVFNYSPRFRKLASFLKNLDIKISR